MAAEAQGLSYRCPACGTMNDDASLMFPNCRQCRENLHKCAYCANFPGVGKVCPVLPNRPLTRADVVPDCCFRRSTLLVGLRPLLLRPLGSPVWLSILACTVFGLIVAAASFFSVDTSTTSSKGLIVNANLGRPGPIRVGEKLTLAVFFENSSADHTENFRIRLPSRCFRKVLDTPSESPAGLAEFRCTNIRPPTVREAMGASISSFYFPPLAPRSRRTIYFQFIAMKAGSAGLTIEVESEGGRFTDHFEVLVEPANPVTEQEANRPSGIAPPARRRPMS